MKDKLIGWLYIALGVGMVGLFWILTCMIVALGR